MIATGKSLQQIEWLGMRFPVPADWEIVRHSVNIGKGRLAFVDHRHQRLLLNWSACEKAPDVAQLFKDYRARDLLENPETSFDELQKKTGWGGFRSTADGEVLTRAGRYDARLKRWIEIIFSWPDGFDAELEGLLLREFDTVSDDDGTSCWRAFGMEIQTPAAWALQFIDAKPGDLCVTFRHGRAEAKVRRTGMAENWFDGDLERFLEKQIAGNHPCIVSVDYDGQPAWVCTSREAGRKLDGLLGRLRGRKDIAWHCGGADAVFQITVLYPRKMQLSPADWHVQSSPGDLVNDFHPGDANPTKTRPNPAYWEQCEEPERLNGAEMLDAVPLRNTSVRADRSKAGELTLHVPLEKRWFMRPPFSWVMPFSRERSVVLDQVGETVWKSCDGKHTINQVVEAFSTRHHVSFHEARMGVMQFLRSLTLRGFIAVTLPEAEVNEG